MNITLKLVYMKQDFIRTTDAFISNKFLAKKEINEE